MRIAVDAMGGDNAPREIVAGAEIAARNSNAEIVLVGDTERVRSCLSKNSPKNITIVHASQIVEMGDSPVKTILKKPDSSLVRCAQMVKDKEADALVSAGNTGAAVAVSKMLWDMIPGISRPAIATIMPNLTGHVVMLDSGATTDCDPEWLWQFAIMGSSFCEMVMGLPSPRVGLLSIGEERGKGNSLVKKAHELFEKSVPNFIGNIEPSDIFKGNVDVAVCDGFAGNLVLKTAEGIITFLQRLIKEELPQNKLMLLPLAMYMGTKNRILKRIDYSEYGGAPLLGVNGITIISHGKSNSKAISSAIAEAEKSVENKLIEKIACTIAGTRETTNA